MSLPIVAILGRPNVGKSTLFNRIIGRRLAIVHEHEGITRDRVAAEADWNGRDFLLVDTGGYMPQTETVIDLAVRQQAEQALQEADVAILVVDAMVGPTAEDEVIAKLIQRSGKPYVLAANKAESQQLDRDAQVFYQLGVEQIFPVSAMNGRAIGDLLDQVTGRLTALPEKPSEEDLIRFAIVGRPNVGKSSLTNALLGVEQQIVTDIPGTTRDAINARIKYYGQTYEMIDTAGLRKKARVKDAVEYCSPLRTQQAIPQADVVVPLIDAERGFETQDAKVIDEVIAAGKGLVVAVNKWDLIEKDHHTTREFSQAILDELPYLRHYPILFISARTRQRIFKVVETVKRVSEERQRRITTRALNLFLEGLVARKQPPAVQGREIKLNYCSQVRSGPPVIIIFSNHPKLLPMAYRRFLENQFRDKFGFQGVPLNIQYRKK